MSTRGIGDNGGPPLAPDLPDGNAAWRLWCWKRTHRRAWKTPPREIALRRLANAEAAGVSYRKYTLEILERGVYLPPAPAPTTPVPPAAPEPRVLERRRSRTPRTMPDRPRTAPRHPPVSP